MNADNVMMDLIPVKLHNSDSPKTNLTNETSDFSSIFDNIVAKNENRAVSAENKNGRRDLIRKQSIDKGDTKTFNEVKKNKRDIKAENSDRFIHNKIKEEEPVLSDENINQLAYAIGIRPEMLQEILKKLDINPDNFIDDQNISISAKKIGESLNLNHSEINALVELMESVQNTEFEQSSQVHNTGLYEHDIFPKVEIQNSDEVQDDCAINASDIFGVSSDEQSGFSFELVNNSELVNNKETQDFQNIMGSIKEKTLLYMANNKILGESAHGTETENMQQQYGAFENQAELEVDVNSKKPLDFEPLLQNISSTGYKPQVLDAYMSDNKVQNMRYQTIMKNDILNQIVEKAKVTLSADKSEMIIDLKPDTLGKLSLNITTERDMVMAKFTAESQQVKEILESNMELLKDMLEKQGFNVQGFSVSVGRDSSQDSSSSKRTSTKMYNSNRINDELAVDLEYGVSWTPKLADYYQWSMSSIDYTA